MRNDTKLGDYLGGHLRYELLMLRYTLSRITSHQSALDWNAYFESFVVHARNLYYFLTNHEKDNVKARDFIDQFKVEKSPKTIGNFLKLHSQVLHLDRKRPEDPSQKFNVDGARELSDWIEQNFTVFIDRLGAEFSSKWDWDGADPSKIKGENQTLVFGPTGPGQPTTTTAPPTIVATAPSQPRRRS